MNFQPQLVIGVILTTLSGCFAFIQGFSKPGGLKVNVHVNLNGKPTGFVPIEKPALGLNGADLVQKKIDLIDRLAVKQINEFKKALRNNSVPKEALKFYAEDVLLFAGNKLYRGKAALDSDWKGDNTANLRNFFKNTQLTPEEIDGNDQVAYEKGSFKRRQVNGKYLVLFKKEDGLYKVQAELYIESSENSNEQKRSPSVNVHVGAPKGSTVHVGPHVNINQLPHSTGDIAQQIENEFLKYREARSNGKLSEVLSHFTNHAVMLVKNAEKISYSGFMELRNYWDKYLDDFQNATYDSERFRGGFGNWGFDYGVYEQNNNEKGVYLAIYHRENEMWKIHMDAFGDIEE